MKRIIPLLLIFCFGLFIRIFLYNSMFGFFGDQGSDLYIAHAILHHGLTPFVGPMLSIISFRMPPTYFYLLALMLSVAKTPEAVGYFTLAMNVAGGAFCFLIIRKLVGYGAALLGASMYAVSFAEVFRSSSFWQPYPATFFIWVSLYLLVEAYEKDRLELLIGSLFAYALSVTIYPSGILLIPFYFLHTYELLGGYRRFSLPAVTGAVGMMVITYAPLMVPQVLYEKSFAATTTTATAMFMVETGLESWKHVLLTGWSNFSLFLHLFWMPYTPLFMSERQAQFVNLGVSAIIGACLAAALLRDRSAATGSLMRFVKLPVLICSFVLIGFYRQDIAPHRTWIFLPFMYLLVSYAVTTGTERWWRILRGVGFGLVVMFIGFQFYVLTVQMRLSELQPMSAQVDQLVSRILADTAAKKKSASDIQVISYLSDPPVNYDPQFYYFLHVRKEINVPLLDDYNFVDEQSPINHNASLIYLICWDVQAKEYTRNQCDVSFLRDHGDFSRGVKFHESPWMVFQMVKVPPQGI